MVIRLPDCTHAFLSKYSARSVVPLDAGSVNWTLFPPRDDFGPQALCALKPNIPYEAGHKLTAVTTSPTLKSLKKNRKKNVKTRETSQCTKNVLCFEFFSFFGWGRRIVIFLRSLETTRDTHLAFFQPFHPPVTP